MTDRTCHIKKCINSHARSQFACRAHWRALPKHLRDAIWTAYKDPGVFSAEYMQAAENADAFLEDRDASDMTDVFS